MRGLVLALMVLLAAGAARAEAVVGQAAGAFAGKTLAGKDFDLAALKGKVVVLHFWATWCVPCQQEMPAIEAVWRQYRAKGLEVLAVSADRARARAEVGQVTPYFSYPFAMLGDVSKNELGTLTAVPVTYVIGKDGVVADIYSYPAQPVTELGLGDEVKALLEAKPEEKIEPKAETKTETK